MYGTISALIILVTIKDSRPNLGTKRMSMKSGEICYTPTYNVLVQKRIAWLLDIRNKAAHGLWSEFTATDVDGMLRQAREFVTDYWI